MSSKKTMTLNLTEDEMKVLETLAAKKDINKTAVLRQALRLYQAVDVRAERGERLVFENDLNKAKAEVVLL
jgi:predicted transcriptional regulator